MRINCHKTKNVTVETKRGSDFIYYSEYQYSVFTCGKGICSIVDILYACTLYRFRIM
jgi:hypothetical protein